MQTTLLALRGSMIAAFVAVLMIAGCAFPGMRVLTMEVYQNDQLIFCSQFDAPDSAGPAFFWQKAGKRPFASEKEVDKVIPSESNPLRATITGPVRIRILHVDRVMTSASLTELTLVRGTHEDSLWYLPEDEVKRAKLAAGF